MPSLLSAGDMVGGTLPPMFVGDHGMLDEDLWVLDGSKLKK
jgi:hypothetical protein